MYVLLLFVNETNTQNYQKAMRYAALRGLQIKIFRNPSRLILAKLRLYGNCSFSLCKINFRHHPGGNSYYGTGYDPGLYDDDSVVSINI